MHKASVVMATNSSVERIRGAIAALTAQTYPSLEIVVVVDRPCPGEEKDEFKRQYPQVVFEFLDAVHYLPAALNAGIRRASGDIIVRCDDDDICTPDRVAEQVKLLGEGNADFVWSTALGKREGDEAHWIIECPATDEEIKRTLIKRNVLVHSTLAGWKAAFETVGLYNPTFIRSQDYEMYMRALRKGMRFGSVQKPLVTRYYGKESITVKHRKNQILYSFCVQILHGANTNDVYFVIRRTIYYMTILLIPDSVRSIRRKLSAITRKGR